MTINYDVITGTPIVRQNFQFLGRDTTVATAGFGTVTGVFLDWYRNMTTLRCRGRFSTGTPTAVTASISLRDGNSNSYTNTTVVGKWWRNNSSGATRKSGTIFTTGGSSAVFFSNDDYTNGGDQGTPIVGNLVASASEILFVDFEVPVTGWDLTQSLAYGIGIDPSGSSLVPGYQTGSFTPTLVSAGGGSQASGLRTGIYTKIGRKVFFTLSVVPGSTASLSAGSLSIIGLPFVASGGVAFSCVISEKEGVTHTANGNPYALIASGNSSVSLAFSYSNGAVTTAMQLSAINSGLLFTISGFYITGS